MEGRSLRPDIRGRQSLLAGSCSHDAPDDWRFKQAAAFDLEFPAAGKRAGNLRLFLPFWRFLTLIHGAIPGSST
jgi:hypothetical protein